MPYSEYVNSNVNFKASNQDRLNEVKNGLTRPYMESPKRLEPGQAVRGDIKNMAPNAKFDRNTGGYKFSNNNR